MVSPFQPRVVGPYTVRDIWLHSRLSLEENGSYPDSFGSNRCSAVPGLQDPALLLTNSITNVVSYIFFVLIAIYFAFMNETKEFLIWVTHEVQFTK
jgi:hypothetical protein